MSNYIQLLLTITDKEVGVYSTLTQPSGVEPTHVIGTFHDYTIDEVTDSYRNQINQIEVIMNSIAKLEFANHKPMNKQKVITNMEQLKLEVLDIPVDMNFEIDWLTWGDTHECDFEPLEDEFAYLIEDVYKFAYKKPITETLLALYETVKVEPIDLVRMLNNITKKHLGKHADSLYDPRELPLGSKADRFDGYFGYQFKVNEKNQKYYLKKKKLGYERKTPTEMKKMVEKHIKDTFEKERLYRAVLDKNEGMFLVYSMKNGEADRLLFKKRLKTLQDPVHIVYVK